MLALLLGAGFSKWAANLPLSSQLFDFAIDAFSVREQERLQRVRHIKDQWDVAHTSGLAEQFIASVLGSGHVRNKHDLLWYIVRRLSEPYIWEEWCGGRMRRHVLMIDENRLFDRTGVQLAQGFIIQSVLCSFAGS